MMPMKRDIEKDLLKWESSPIRSPLMLIGPRQCGKTTVLRNFAEQIGKRVFEINFWEDHNQTLAAIFKRTGNPEKILTELADYFHIAEINTKEDVLFFDEIQECAEAYASLKMFKEKVKELRILVTGSYLQLFLKNEEIKKLPVGCVDEFQMGPLTFSEFLENYDSLLFQKYLALDIDAFHISLFLHERLLEKMYEYFFTGGMPEVVFLYLNGKKNFDDREAVRKKQKDLLTQYILDFQKYGKGVHVKKIDKLFQSIPLQLEKVSDEPANRFLFSELGKNEKYHTLHWSFQFLESAGLIIRSYLVSKIDHPFRVHEQNEERNIFKCFYFDIGLLNAALDSNTKMQIDEWGSYKGYIAENFVAISLFNYKNRELITYKKSSKNGSAEVEFLLSSRDGEVIPIEVKSSMKSQRSKSLIFFIKEFKPKKAFKLVPCVNEGVKAEGYLSLPLYLIDKISAIY